MPGSTDWCERHAELFRQNGVPPEKILNDVIKLLQATWKHRTGLKMNGDDASVKLMVNTICKGKPFCCWMGDDKLQRILVSVSTDVAKKRREQYVDDGKN